MPFDRETFFNLVRQKPFNGKLAQQQVDGMNAILGAWEADFEGQDLRWLANPLAQTYHETGGAMWPIEEYKKGEGQPYGKKDPETGQTYYGRGYVQITWRENYARADSELGLTKDTGMEWHAERALDSTIAADTMFQGMMAGWFRKSGSPATPNTLMKYFNTTTNDVYNAREIINGDKSKVPSWSNGVSIGNLIVGYHNNFLAALEASYSEDIAPAPDEEPVVLVTIIAPPGVKIEVKVLQDAP